MTLTVGIECFSKIKEGRIHTPNKTKHFRTKDAPYSPSEESQLTQLDFPFGPSFIRYLYNAYTHMLK